MTNKIEHCGVKDCPECNKAAFEAGVISERARVLQIIVEEINIAHTTPELAGGKTSRLTSAYNRISSDEIRSNNQTS